jgi:DNA-binding transcriptional regulator YhcF (GntR family)
MALYKDIAREYQLKVDASELNPGDRLPTLIEMAELHSITRDTAGRVTRELRRTRYIRTTTTGSFVTEAP